MNSFQISPWFKNILISFSGFPYVQTFAQKHKIRLRSFSGSLNSIWKSNQSLLNQTMEMQ